MENITEILAAVQSRIGLQVSNNSETQGNFVDSESFAPPPESPKQLRERLIASGFPEDYIDRPPAEYRVDDNNREAMEKAKEFVNEPNGAKGLYICGPYGTGKTWLAVLIGRKMAERGKWVAFGTFSQITNNLQRALKSNGEYERLWTRYTEKAELLIIDDMGKEKPSEWKLQTLFDIIDAREHKKLFTVFTSNYNLAELCERIAPSDSDNITAGAIRSRLGGKHSSEKYVPLVLGGEDRR